MNILSSNNNKNVAEVSAPLHILHGVLSLDVGGLERIVLSLIRPARKRGHRVSIVCIERPGRLASEAEAEGATVVSLNKPSGRLPAFIQRATGILADLSPDVIHTHQIGAAWYLCQGARSLGRPVIHTEHGNHFSQPGGWRQVIKIRLFMRSISRHIDQFCCVSDEIAAAMTRWWTVPAAKVAVVPNGIATDVRADLPSPESLRASLLIPASAPVIGTVGRLATVKRQDTLIRAVRRVWTKLPEVRLLLVGDGSERANLETISRELGLAERVHFLGYQSCPEQFIRIMDVFGLTSRSEGFPVSLLEAWRQGVPVVSTAVGGIPSVVNHGVNGLLVPPGDEVATAEALARVLGDRSFGNRLGQSGRQELLDRYSLDKMMMEYEQRYRALLAPKQSNIM
jgi:glycosyltransferase involved in cell wall biosynthesis